MDQSWGGVGVVLFSYLSFYFYSTKAKQLKLDLLYILFTLSWKLSSFLSFQLWNILQIFQVFGFSLNNQYT